MYMDHNNISGLGAGFKVFDTRVSPKGIQYGVSGYVTDDRSLTDRGYVLGSKTFTGTQTLRAGTTAADTSPLRWVSGPLMTAPQIGAMEFLTDKWYGTITTGTARKEFTLNDAALGSGRIPYTNASGRLISSDNLIGDDTYFISRDVGNNNAFEVLHNSGLDGGQINSKVTSVSGNYGALLILDANDTIGQAIAGLAVNGVGIAASGFNFYDIGNVDIFAAGGAANEGIITWAVDGISAGRGVSLTSGGALNYDNDYSSTYTSRSLIDLGSADAKYWKVTGTTTLTGDVNIEAGSGYSFKFGTAHGTNDGTWGSAMFGELGKIDSTAGAAFLTGEYNWVKGYGGFAIGRTTRIGNNSAGWVGTPFGFIGGYYTVNSQDPQVFHKGPQIGIGVKGAFGFYDTDASQTDYHGVNADYSAILQTFNGNIPVSSPNSVTIGGNAVTQPLMKARASDPSQVYVPNLNIAVTPLNDEALTQVLVRDNATGQIKYRDFLGAKTFTGTQTFRTGSATAGTAPLKFVSGALNTVAEVGAVEFLTDKFYGTITTGAARKEFTLNDASLTAGRIPYTTTNGRLTSNANLIYSPTDISLGIEDGSSNAGLTGGSFTGSNYIELSTNNGTYASGFGIDPNNIGASGSAGAYYYDENPASTGIRYVSDFSANYTSRSLIDRGYVLGAKTFTGTQTFRTGTTGAGTSPYKMVSGPLMTAPEVGAHEFLTDKFYATITTGAARKEFTLNDAALTSGRIPYTTTNGRLTDSANFTATSSALTLIPTTSAVIESTTVYLGGSGGVLLITADDNHINIGDLGGLFGGDLLDISATSGSLFHSNTSSPGSGVGLQYAADYSANYTSRSLADWGSIRGAKTFTGKQTFANPGTTAASFNLPVSAAPSSPVDGDVWREDNTNTGLKIRINGVTKTITVS